MASMANRQMEFATEKIKENHSNWLKSRSDVYDDESGAQIYCLVDDPEAIERQMKRAIANRLVHLHSILVEIFY
ncbi:putative conjugative transfer protein TraN [Orientia tsutsugamushi str. UT144]|uniref:Putative conjugative transfer protein TraN n=1 Tax=Orientia tsutsugamushi str. UT144 TaxID=1441384 RepID=A0A0F3RMS2_ORITS|nr:putative conjugative transfer protein TraN [Orientia tsutsugamushi str. UT144]